MLQLKNIVKDYGSDETIVHALKGIDLSFRNSEFVAILGPSGCGKTTMLNIIGGLDRYTSGDVLINGKSTTLFKNNDWDAYRNNYVGFIFQNYNLINHQTILENVELALTLSGISVKERKARAIEALKNVGLDGQIHKKPNQLSGGQMQRVAIARALASDPKILLCDEATSALDPQTTYSILELLKNINNQFGITIVIITHQMSVVREICTHVAIMDKGVVVEQGKVTDIFTHPKSNVAKELIRKDSGNEVENNSTITQELIHSGKRIRIIFSENSAFEPVISNLVLMFHEPVNILKADTKNVGGVAKGEMILEFAKDSIHINAMKKYLDERGLDIEEVVDYVDG